MSALTKEEFCELINKCQLTEDKLAILLDVARPTVSRWRTGASCPHFLVRDIVVRLLAEFNSLNRSQE